MRKRRPTSWLLGFAGSAVVHVCLLVALFAMGRMAPASAGLDAPPGSDVIALTAVDPTFGGADPLSAAIPVDVEPPARAWDAHESDRDSLVPLSTAPSASDGRQRLAPAPDRGEAGGHRPDHAFRRDDSTLRSRLTDGAGEAQPAHTRTSGRSASPQAIRREPVVGMGDSVRTQTPKRVPSPSPAVGGLDGAGPQSATAEAAASAEAPLPAPSAELAALAASNRAIGPLDADPGMRSFDTERQGRATDDETMRAASNERHPGLTDFTRPAAPAATNTGDGHGPGSRAGAVTRPASGTAPSELGLPDSAAAADDVNERSRARRYARYELEIQGRVKAMFYFPKRLALRLEQGVTIVYFVVGADGRLADGPRVVKSSGFDEFDTAAIGMVRRAAPFPRMPFNVPISMSVIFDNPVIR